MLAVTGACKAKVRTPDDAAPPAAPASGRHAALEPPAGLRATSGCDAPAGTGTATAACDRTDTTGSPATCPSARSRWRARDGGFVRPEIDPRSGRLLEPGLPSPEVLDWLRHQGKKIDEYLTTLSYWKGYTVGELDDAHFSNQAQRSSGRAAVALVRRGDLRRGGSSYAIQRACNCMQTWNLCSDEPFAEQRSLSICSGFLIARGVVATAGHCIGGPREISGAEHNRALEELYFVFDYKVSSGQEPTSLPEASVFVARPIREADIQLWRRYTRGGEDWALVRLTRAPERPAIADGQAAEVARPLYAIGFPLGQPAKIAAGRVADATAAGAYFGAAVGAFVGSSGSMVLDHDEHRLLGMIVRGRDDFCRCGACSRCLVYDPGEEQRYEEVLRSRTLYRALGSLPPP